MSGSRPCEVPWCVALTHDNEYCAVHRFHLLFEPRGLSAPRWSPSWRALWRWGSSVYWSVLLDTVKRMTCWMELEEIGRAV